MRPGVRSCTSHARGGCNRRRRRRSVDLVPARWTRPTRRSSCREGRIRRGEGERPGRRRRDRTRRDHAERQGAVADGDEHDHRHLVDRLEADAKVAGDRPGVGVAPQPDRVGIGPGRPRRRRPPDSGGTPCRRAGRWSSGRPSRRPGPGPLRPISRLSPSMAEGAALTSQPVGTGLDSIADVDLNQRRHGAGPGGPSVELTGPYTRREG